MAERIIKPDAGSGNKLTLQDEGGTQTLTVADGAKVGVGTDAPAIKFHIADNYPDWSSKLVNTHSGGYGYVSSAGGASTYAMLLLDYSEANTLFAVKGSGDVFSTDWTSFTPTLTGVTSLLVVQGARYLRIGSLMFCNIYITGTRDGTVSTCTITGLPFLSADIAGYTTGVSIGYAVLGGVQVDHLVSGRFFRNTTTISLSYNGSDSGWGVSGSQQISLSLFYQAKSW